MTFPQFLARLRVRIKISLSRPFDAVIYVFKGAIIVDSIRVFMLDGE